MKFKTIWQFLVSFPEFLAANNKYSPVNIHIMVNVQRIIQLDKI